MPDPYRGRGPKRRMAGGVWPSAYLQERVAALFGAGSVGITEDLIAAFGDPDTDDSAAVTFNVADSDLRRLVQASRGETVTDPVRPGIESDPTAVVADDEFGGTYFDIGATVAALLDHVGSDPRRALEVLSAERSDSNPHAPRSTLTAQLEKIIRG